MVIYTHLLYEPQDGSVILQEDAKCDVSCGWQMNKNTCMLKLLQVRRLAYVILNANMWKQSLKI